MLYSQMHWLANSMGSHMNFRHGECLKPCPHYRRKVRLSPKTATQRRQSPNSATVALFCDRRCFRRQIVAEIGVASVDRLLFSRNGDICFRSELVECQGPESLTNEHHILVTACLVGHRSRTGSFCSTSQFSHSIH